MNKYHKIDTIFKRDLTQKTKPLIFNEWACPEFEYLKDCIWECTEKVDGTNIRIIYENNVITFKGKTDNSDVPKYLLVSLNDKILPKLNIFKDIFGDTSVCLYGEGYGNKIQKVGHLYRKDNDFVLFDVKIGHIWLTRNDVDDIGKKLNLDTVPICYNGTLYNIIEFVEKGYTSSWGDFLAEGVVAVPKIGVLSRLGKRIITKIKHRDFR